MLKHPGKMELNWREQVWPKPVNKIQLAKSLWLVSCCRLLSSGICMGTYDWLMLLQKCVNKTSQSSTQNRFEGITISKRILVLDQFLMGLHSQFTAVLRAKPIIICEVIQKQLHSPQLKPASKRIPSGPCLPMFTPLCSPLPLCTRVGPCDQENTVELRVCPLEIRVPTMLSQLLILLHQIIYLGGRQLPCVSSPEKRPMEQQIEAFCQHE